MSTVKEITLKMKANSPLLAATTGEERVQALKKVRESLLASKEAIFEANHKDLDRAKKEGISDSVIKRLKFDEEKLSTVISGIEALEAMEDPLGEVTLNRELSEGLILRRISVPIGVIGVIFEARPDALVQISTLCIKSGNMCILKGGKETDETNAVLFDVIYKAAREAGLPEYCLYRVSSHNEINELLTCNGSCDLLIPRGSNSFVKYIMDNTSIPVLGHADGICHTYVDSSADIDIALKVCLDAKTQYTAACNATETLLVAENIADAFLPAMAEIFREAGVKIRAMGRACELTGGEPIGPEDFRTEYLDMVIGIKLVKNVQEAVDHINSHGSHHTDAIITTDDEAWKYFSAMVDSANVYRNASTRFADGFRYGFGAEVGISTSKIHARGPVGLFGLLTYKYILEGQGHRVTDFQEGKKSYTFKNLD